MADVIGSYQYWQQRLTNLGCEMLPEWKPYFTFMDESYVHELSDAMARAAITSPAPEVVFRPFQDIRPCDIKVVILGQDPYPNPEDAIGRAFASVSQKMPRSLATIMRAAGGFNGARNAALDGWVDQGVFLLNACPVLYEGSSKPNNHWERFTSQIIHQLYVRQRPKYILMGKRAQHYAKYVGDPDLIIDLPHPTARAGQFAACSPFDVIRLLCPEIVW